VASADKPGRTPVPFDVKTVETLIGLMATHDLNEVDLQDGDSRIRLKRGHLGAVTVAMPAVTPAHAVAPTTSAAAPAPSAAPADNGKKHHTITSPTPGTFYAKPTPDDPAYVQVGSKVNPESVVCKIEAMKIFNDIVAECSGTIVEVLVENAQPVEYGQPLFKVEV
jgi:acetyl-CoA carboxylase biotin carboxyl carrier protein